MVEVKRWKSEREILSGRDEKADVITGAWSEVSDHEKDRLLMRLVKSAGLWREACEKP